MEEKRFFVPLVEMMSVETMAVVPMNYDGDDVQGYTKMVGCTNQEKKNMIGLAPDRRMRCKNTRRCPIAFARHPPANLRPSQSKCRMKHRSGFRALGHFPRLALHQHFVSQDRRNASVSPVDTYIPSILLLSGG
ncbi:hypothetical protein HAX54_021068 [Datura stramonium]|uniref:Uncharacterized protein n=1 Tax=Datura stramonium TaxID=4076 RepID=A0ABS8US24_DATST|nr:hypothetical protein [Datura stramonium]